MLFTAVLVLLLQQPEIMSLLGEPLYAPSLSKHERARAEANLSAARAAYEKQPSAPAAVLALEQAYLIMGRVGDALEALTHGIEAAPDDGHLYLARGRDYIRIRKFDIAERDLRKAAETLPEARCDVAFALYLSGRFANARDSYAACGDTGVFRYLAERRAGNPAARRPAPTGPGPATSPTIRFPGSVAPPKQVPAQPIAADYLDAMERLLAGDEEGCRGRLKKIVDKHRRDWMEAAYIAAEADYARLKPPDRRRRKTA